MKNVAGKLSPTTAAVFLYKTYGFSHALFVNTASGCLQFVAFTPRSPLSRNNTSHFFGPRNKKLKMKESNSFGGPQCELMYASFVAVIIDDSPASFALIHA